MTSKPSLVSPEAYTEDCTFFALRNKIPIVDLHKITPFDFYRNYVAPSQPCILLNAFNHWPANTLWNDSHDTIVTKCGKDRLVTCNFTPNGHGDAIHEHLIFVKPEERQIKFGDAWNQIQHQTKPEQGVPYLSFQNDSLRTQFECLEEDIDVNGLEFANTVFQGNDRASSDIAAINLWIGDHRSVSSVHKDPFDNIYCVVRGTKTFTLLPPTDVNFLQERAFPSASYCQRKTNESKGGTQGGTFDIVLDRSSSSSSDDNNSSGSLVVVPWCEVDPACPDLKRFPQFQHASPLQVEVHAGETLFLPALWYHRVGSKNGLTIAVNYWYEMSFGPVYTAYQLARRLSGLKPEHEYNASDLTTEQVEWCSTCGTHGNTEATDVASGSLAQTTTTTTALSSKDPHLDQEDGSGDRKEKATSTTSTGKSAAPRPRRPPPTYEEDKECINIAVKVLIKVQ